MFLYVLFAFVLSDDEIERRSRRAIQETTMRLSVKMIATAAFAVLLVPGFNLFASEAAKLSTGAAKDDKSVDSTVAVVTDPAALLPAAPMPAASMPPAMPYSGGVDSYYPKVELFMGYSYLRAVPTLAAGNRMVWLNGGSTSVAFNLNRYLGLVGDFGGFNETRLLLTSGNPPTAVGPYQAVDDGTVFTYLVGPRLSLRKHDRITPFVQVLFGGIHASEESLCPTCTASLPAENSFALTAGGGLDVRLRHRLAIRIIQAEYVMSRFENLDTGSTQAQNNVRLSTGIVFRFGGPPPLQVTLACAANPESIFPGDPVTVTATAGQLDPKLNAVYSWTGSGVTGNGSTATVATGSLAPGSYTVKCGVKEGKAGKEGLKPWETADASASFTVKAFEPPTVGCTANPSTVNAGDPSTITATGVSPQNRPLTYSYSSTAGSVSGTGSTASLTTVGAAAGAIGVTCNVVDDKGQTASGSTTVTVVIPAPPPKPTVSEMCSVSFTRDSRRPSRVDNEGKACLDQVALNLQSNADGKLALVGNAASTEKGGIKLATERAVNTKAYLVSEKGIDPSRISVYTGSQDGKVVSTIFIPAGATFDAAGDTPVQ
jgi:outer membrane protein OmpA-like peptidoglycan-associated protein